MKRQIKEVGQAIENLNLGEASTLHSSHDIEIIFPHIQTGTIYIGAHLCVYTENELVL